MFSSTRNAHVAIAIAFLACLLVSCRRAYGTPTPQPPTNEPPSVYYAAFGLEFVEGAWEESQIYTYHLEVKQCGTDNFAGNTIPFDVTTGLADVPFYLLKDGVYDHPDRNIARPAHASSSQRSYAMVILPRITALETEQILNECSAFISINNGALLSLDPYRQGPIPGFGPGGTFQLDASAFSIAPFP